MIRIKSTAARLAVAALAAAFVASGCASGPSARIKGDDEDTLVDTKRGGTEVYDVLVQRAVNELLAEHRASLGTSAEKITLAFVGIENRSSEELGEFRDAVYNEIDTALVNSRLYINVNRRAVDAAKREAGVRDAADLVLGKQRDAFMGVLGRGGITPEYLMYGTMTSKTSRGNEEKERTYQLTMEMMDSRSGQTVTKKTVNIRKAYTK